MSLVKFLVKRAAAYAAIFIAAVTFIWLLVRFAPGDPALASVMRLMIAPGVSYTEEQIQEFRRRAIEMLGWNLPLHEQYLLFWSKLLRWDLGYSTYYSAPVASKIGELIVRDLLLLSPATVVGWFLGNWVGALAARFRKLDKVLLPVLYVLTSTPYFLLGLVLAYSLGVVFPVFKPTVTSSDIDALITSPSLETLQRFLKAYTLPFLSVVAVSLGGWASGMRSLMMYELESNYARFLEALGFSSRAVASYAMRHAINPQITGLGIQFGTIILGGIAISAIFNYPGAGIALIYAINFKDIFLLQGIIIVYVAMVLAACLIVDLVYVVVDPRIRIGVMGA